MLALLAFYPAILNYYHLTVKCTMLLAGVTLMSTSSFNKIQLFLNLQSTNP